MHVLAACTLLLVLAGAPEGRRKPPIGGGELAAVSTRHRRVPLAPKLALPSIPTITGAVGQPARALRQPQPQPRRLLQAAAGRYATAKPRSSSAAPAIASGVLAGEVDFPYAVMLMRSASQPFGCGGSLIARDKVITAARERARHHCRLGACPWPAQATAGGCFHATWQAPTATLSHALSCVAPLHTHTACSTDCLVEGTPTMVRVGLRDFDTDQPGAGRDFEERRVRVRAAGCCRASCRPAPANRRCQRGPCVAADARPGSRPVACPSPHLPSCAERGAAPTVQWRQHGLRCRGDPPHVSGDHQAGAAAAAARRARGPASGAAQPGVAVDRGLGQDSDGRLEPAAQVRGPCGASAWAACRV